VKSVVGLVPEVPKARLIVVRRGDLGMFEGRKFEWSVGWKRETVRNPTAQVVIRSMMVDVVNGGTVNGKLRTSTSTVLADHSAPTLLLARDFLRY